MEKNELTDIKSRLFDAFREDHAVFGRALHELSTRLCAGDAAGVRQAAARLDAAAGAHIAFEEADFYPALAPFLSKEEIDTMYREHADGQLLLTRLKHLEAQELKDTKTANQLLERVHDMETHVSECGELFGAMGGLEGKAQRDLLDQLQGWRTRAPLWSELELAPAASDA